MDIILIPGLWLDGSSWDEVVPALEQAGHRTNALTLPGMESKHANRSEITLRDHVDAVVQVIDSGGPAGGKVVLVGHSGGGASARQQLSDERRYDVPVTVIACEYPSAMLREWMEQGHPYVRELAKIRDVDYIDLPTGHWPQFTRPGELGRAILDSVGPA